MKNIKKIILLMVLVLCALQDMCYAENQKFLKFELNKKHYLDIDNDGQQENYIIKPCPMKRKPAATVIVYLQIFKNGKNIFPYREIAHPYKYLGTINDFEKNNNLVIYIAHGIKERNFKDPDEDYFSIELYRFNGERYYYYGDLVTSKKYPFHYQPALDDNLKKRIHSEIELIISQNNLTIIKDLVVGCKNIQITKDFASIQDKNDNFYLAKLEKDDWKIIYKSPFKTKTVPIIDLEKLGISKEHFICLDWQIIFVREYWKHPNP